MTNAAAKLPKTVRRRLDFLGDPPSGYVRLMLRVEERSKAAIKMTDGIVSKWVPKKCIRDLESIGPVGHMVKVDVAAWFARKEAMV